MLNFARMERIKLSKDEKKVLRHLQNGWQGYPSNMDSCPYSCVVTSLVAKKLVRARFCEGHIGNAAKLTNYGIAYLTENPHLWNPVDWNVVIAVGSVVTAAISFAALFVACAK